MDTVLAMLEASTSFLFSFGSRLAFFYLAATIALVLVIWLVRGRPNSFIDFMLPREVYLHKSNLVDLKIFVFNMVLKLSGFLAFVAVAPVVANWVLGSLSSNFGSEQVAAVPTLSTILLATVVIIVTNDFCTYWVHRTHHEAKALWPFHSVHHSAEIMTPLTAYRKHPIYDLFSHAFRAVLLGLAQGIMLYFVVGKISVLTIGSVNAGYVIFNFLGSNLRHSHIWLSYGRVLEHIFISPAQHQIHHSVERRHYNKNYGEVFAFWDWMFGTLYVPKTHEKLAFGLSDENGQRVEQPHPTLHAALVLPFHESWQALWTGTSRERPPASVPEQSLPQ